MEKRTLCFYRDDVNYLNVNCFIANNDMYFDINHLNRILLNFQVNFHYHKQVKISDIISRRFGDFMTPLSRVEMRIKN